MTHPTDSPDSVHSVSASAQTVQGHTPGPWAVFDHSWSDISVAAVDGNAIRSRVCLLRISEEATEETQDSLGAVNMANARLIAAAPAPLAALHSAAESLEQLVKIARIPANNKGLRDARAAIALATEAS